MCLFSEAWIGKCKVTGEPFCEKHSKLVCSSCGEQATRECDETGQLVCGAPLCDNCEHRIFEDGTNGGIGFNAQSLPPGQKTHVRKTEQTNKPWYMTDKGN